MLNLKWTYLWYTVFNNASRSTNNGHSAYTIIYFVNLNDFSKYLLVSLPLLTQGCLIKELDQMSSVWLVAVVMKVTLCSIAPKIVVCRPRWRSGLGACFASQGSWIWIPAWAWMFVFIEIFTKKIFWTIEN